MGAAREHRSTPSSELDRRFAEARAVADAVCYEGYLLYPYRASARKNQVRWQFGVLAPASVAAGGSERPAAQAELVVESRAGARLQVRLRALQVQQRVVESATADGFAAVSQLDDGSGLWTSFDEAVEHQADLVGVRLDTPTGQDDTLTVQLPGACHEETILAVDGTVKGRVVRRRWPVTASLRVTAVPIDGPYPLTRVTLAVANETDWAAPGAGRDEAMRHSLVAAHLLVSVDFGRFISSLDPPRFAAGAVAGCTNVGLFPVLVGDDDDVVLASPIILYDHPAIAPESEGDMFDATEIDEILALRVRTLTDSEKREARGTDPRSAAIIDRCDAMGVDALGALHGTFRSIRQLRAEEPDPPAGEPPWWEPEVDAAFDPWTDSIELGGRAVGNGSRVRLRPSRRSDAQDFFVDGRQATVAGVFHDVSGETYLAVTVDDPDADLLQWHGRYLYFHPEEVEVLEARAPRSAAGVDVGRDTLGCEVVAALSTGLDRHLEPPARFSRVLVAGIGNIFLGDDGFGSEVARHLDAATLPTGVNVVDFGIRGVHLAYELLEGYDTVILIDAVSRGDPPGTVSVIEHGPGGDLNGTLAAMDAHGMDPGAVLAMAGDLGARLERVLVVGCEVAKVAEGIGLSEPVAEAVPRAVACVEELLTSIAHSQAAAEPPPAGPSTGSLPKEAPS